MYVRLIVLDLLLLGAGTALLAGLGYVRTARDAARYAGLALVTGWVTVGTLVALALVAGLSGRVWQIVLAASLVAAVGAAASRRFDRLDDPVERPATRPGHALALLAAAALSVLLAALVRRGRVAEPTNWDVWAFWLPRARSLVINDGIHLGAGGWDRFANADYPPLAPTLDAIVLRFAGTLEADAVALQRPVIAAAVVAGGAALLAGRVRPEILWPGLFLVAATPGFQNLAGSMLADELLAGTFALAGTAAALWLLRRAPRDAVLCGIFVAAGALLKNEGLMLGLLLAATLTLATRFRALRVTVPLGAAAIAAVIPWRSWSRSHDLGTHGAYRWRDLTDPDFVASRLDSLAIGLRELPGYFVGYDRWLVVVPVALVVAVAVARRSPALATLVLVPLLVAYVGQAVIYAISPLEIYYYIDTSAARIVSAPALFAGVLAPLVVAEAFRDRAREA